MLKEGWKKDIMREWKIKFFQKFSPDYKEAFEQTIWAIGVALKEAMSPKNPFLKFPIP